MNEDHRITELEIRIAEQERTIEELSSALADQWKAFEAMRRKLDRLTERVDVVEENAGGETPVTKPPHW